MTSHKPSLLSRVLSHAIQEIVILSNLNDRGALIGRRPWANKRAFSRPLKNNFLE